MFFTEVYKLLNCGFSLEDIKGVLKLKIRDVNLAPLYIKNSSDDMALYGRLNDKEIYAEKLGIRPIYNEPYLDIFKLIKFF